MRSATETEIRASFINCSKGEAKRLLVPSDLPRRPWAELDFLGWNDPGAPERNYLVAERDGLLVGIGLRAASGRDASGRVNRAGLCGLCVTPQPGSGVRLMTAAKAGPSGRMGNSVGTFVCADLCCSLYVRGLKKLTAGVRLNENLTLEQQIERIRGNLFAFLDNVNG